MERKASPDSKPIWRKLTQGTLYPFPNQRKRRVKYKEEIEATEEELGRNVNQFELIKDGTGRYKTSEDAKLNPQARVEKQEKVLAQTPPPEKDTYTVEEASKGWFNVVSSTGKVINDKKLRKAEADALKESLEQETSGPE